MTYQQHELLGPSLQQSVGVLDPASNFTLQLFVVAHMSTLPDQVLPQIIHHGRLLPIVKFKVCRDPLCSDDSQASRGQAFRRK